LNSPVSSCTRIDEPAVANVSREWNKIFDEHAKLETGDDFLRVADVLFFSGYKSFLKEMRKLDLLRPIAPAVF
jgi:hypothetical protein